VRAIKLDSRFRGNDTQKNKSAELKRQIVNLKKERPNLLVEPLLARARCAYLKMIIVMNMLIMRKIGDAIFMTVNPRSFLIVFRNCMTVSRMHKAVEVISEIMHTICIIKMLFLKYWGDETISGVGAMIR
jgi:hypothetical protein